MKTLQSAKMGSLKDKLLAQAEQTQAALETVESKKKAKKLKAKK